VGWVDGADGDVVIGTDVAPPPPVDASSSNPGRGGGGGEGTTTIPLVDVVVIVVRTTMPRTISVANVDNSKHSMDVTVADHRHRPSRQSNH
jgi:hypothetical protein